MFGVWFGFVFVVEVCFSSRTRASTSVVRNAHLEDVVQRVELQLSPFQSAEIGRPVTISMDRSFHRRIGICKLTALDVGLR